MLTISQIVARTTLPALAMARAWLLVNFSYTDQLLIDMALNAAVAIAAGVSCLLLLRKLCDLGCNLILLALYAASAAVLVGTVINRTEDMTSEFVEMTAEGSGSSLREWLSVLYDAGSAASASVQSEMESVKHAAPAWS